MGLITNAYNELFKIQGEIEILRGKIEQGQERLQQELTSVRQAWDRDEIEIDELRTKSVVLMKAIQNFDKAKQDYQIKVDRFPEHCKTLKKHIQQKVQKGVDKKGKPLKEKKTKYYALLLKCLETV